jgi:hypothetical protein
VIEVERERERKRERERERGKIRPQEFHPTCINNKTLFYKCLLFNHEIEERGEEGRKKRLKIKINLTFGRSL